MKEVPGSRILLARFDNDCFRIYSYIFGISREERRGEVGGMEGLSSCHPVLPTNQMF